MLQVLYFPLFILLLLCYFRLANRFNIIDQPNHRSSHKEVTLRGGGIIFPIALLMQFCLDPSKWYFLLGLLAISLVSFIDDIRPLSNKVRLLVHLVAVSLLFFQIDFFSVVEWWIVLLSYVFVIGSINAYNFMDGINGITGGYSLVIIISLWLANKEANFIDTGWIESLGYALLAFNFFNFRKKAKCFAGDVGSVSLAYIILFLLLSLIIYTSDLKYAGFLLVYGLDAASTVVFRIIRKEDIFEAHRSHLYQYLANTLKWPHLLVSLLYMGVQLVINLAILRFDFSILQILISLVTAFLIFVAIRFLTEGKERLLAAQNVQ